MCVWGDTWGRFDWTLIYSPLRSEQITGLSVFCVGCVCVCVCVAIFLAVPAGRRNLLGCARCTGARLSVCWEGGAGGALAKGLSVCSLASAQQRAGPCAYVFSSPRVCVLQAPACVAFADAVGQILS